ncbi:MAG: TorF family putative porin [Desulfosudaceae bacterium]
MKRLGLVLCVLGLCSVIGIGSTSAASVSAGADVVSAYVWRGITFNDGAVVQPFLDVTTEKGFGLNVWGNYDLDDYDGTLESEEFSEIDLTLSYGFSLGPVDMTIGHIEYTFPNGAQATSELFAGGSVELLAGLSAGLDFYYDYDEVDEYYLSAGLSYDLELADIIGLGFGATAGYAGNRYAADGDHGLYDYNFSITADVPVTDAISLSAFVAYTESFDNDTLPDQDVDFYGGGGFSIAF